MNQEYRDLLSDYLTNYFRMYDTYQGAVVSALQDLSKDYFYLERMKEVFNYFLNEKFEENVLRDIIRTDTNFFVTNDELALKRLRYIYEDTIIEVAEEDLGAEQSNEFREVELANIDKESLLAMIFDKSKNISDRVNAARVLDGMNDALFQKSIRELITEENSTTRYSFILLFIALGRGDDKVKLLASLLANDSQDEIRSTIAHHLGVYKNMEKQSELVTNILKNALQKESSDDVILAIREALNS